jgi:predicted small lipoprotein YifL
MRRKRKMLSTAALAFLLASAAGACREKGPVERAGEKVDDAVDRAKDALDPKGPAEKAGEKIDKALD